MAENIQIPNVAIPPSKKELTLTARTVGLNFLKGRIIAFSTRRPNPLVTVADLPEIQGYEGNTPETTKSQIGNTKFGQFIIKTSENVQIGDTRTSFQAGEGYAILETAIGSISQERNIITTPIAGRNGTVKEYISDGDFVISVTGKIVDNGNKFPDDQVTDIANIFKVPNELVIVNSFLFNFDIKNVVIKSYKIEQIEGAENLYNISIEMLSDDAIEVKLGIKDA